MQPHPTVGDIIVWKDGDPGVVISDTATHFVVNFYNRADGQRVHGILANTYDFKYGRISTKYGIDYYWYFPFKKVETPKPWLMISK